MTGHSPYVYLCIWTYYICSSYCRSTLRCRELWGMQGVLQEEHQEAAGLQLQAEQGVRGHQARQEQVRWHFLSLSLSVYLCLSVYISVVCTSVICKSVSPWLSLSSLFLSLSLSHSLPTCLSIYWYLCLFYSLSLFPSVSLYVSLSISLSIYISL